MGRAVFDDNREEFNEHHDLCLSFKFWSHGRLNLFFNPHFRNVPLYLPPVGIPT
jgi:hypothetical protein